MIIHLYNHNSVGLLVPLNPSVCWVVRVGGVNCGRRFLQGVYVPLPNIEVPPTLKDVYQKYDPMLVQTFLNENACLKKAFTPLDNDSLPEQQRFGLAEAWVPLRVSNYGGLASEMPELVPLKGTVVILIYKNSK